jgi:WhiB family transcriptional regulator, redox-sensing transcriptional regulator
MIGVDLHDLIPPRPAWMVDAACREHPEVDFFPGRGGDARPAQAVCRGCEVRDICLTYAQENGECGVWGGRVLKWSDRRLRRKADVEALDAPARSQETKHTPGRSEPVEPPTARPRARLIRCASHASPI